VWQITHIRFLEGLPELIGYDCDYVLHWECLGKTAFSLFSRQFCLTQRESTLCVKSWSLSQLQGAFSFGRWKRLCPGLDVTRRCIEYAVSDSTQGVVFKLWGYARG
jgi:hypothetical protein